jgi:hypothetical protein
LQAKSPPPPCFRLPPPGLVRQSCTPSAVNTDKKTRKGTSCFLDEMPSGMLSP